MRLNLKTYYIDGNNLIGKVKNLWALQQKDKQASREKLSFILDRYFSTRNHKVVLYFDGHSNVSINTSKLKIMYSENRTADDIIKTAIERNKNPRNLVVVTSDHSLMDFSRVCNCEVVSSTEFAQEIMRPASKDEEEEKKKSISDDDIKKLFGI